MRPARFRRRIRIGISAGSRTGTRRRSKMNKCLRRNRLLKRPGCSIFRFSMKIQERAVYSFLLLLPLAYGCATSNSRTVVSAQSALSPGPYVWKSVQIVGGGFVDGIVFHPTAKGVRYCRTDIGGAYRWDDSQKIWVPILDWVSYKDTNLMGVESIAVDPSDPNRVYLACGTYTNKATPNGAILRSSDRGRTFERTDVPFKFGGNEDGR